MKQSLVLLIMLFFPLNAQEPVAVVADTPWGYHTVINLKGCSPELIQNKLYIKAYVYTLCALIGMKRFGSCTVVHFGQDERVAGYSMFQLIETSCISGHFANESNCAYIDIFSCKKYDVEIAVRFTKEAFLAKDVEFQLIERT